MTKILSRILFIALMLFPVILSADQPLDIDAIQKMIVDSISADDPSKLYEAINHFNNRSLPLDPPFTLNEKFEYEDSERGCAVTIENLLINAASKGSVRTFKVLIEIGASPNSIVRGGKDVLHVLEEMACLSGDERFVEQALKYKGYKGIIPSIRTALFLVDLEYSKTGHAKGSESVAMHTLLRAFHNALYSDHRYVDHFNSALNEFASLGFRFREGRRSDTYSGREVLYVLNLNEEFTKKGMGLNQRAGIIRDNLKNGRIRDMSSALSMYEVLKAVYARYTQRMVTTGLEHTKVRFSDKSKKILIF